MAGKASLNVKRDELYGILGEYFTKIDQLIAKCSQTNHKHGMEDISGIQNHLPKHSHVSQDVRDLHQYRTKMLEDLQKYVDDRLAGLVPTTTTVLPGALKEVSDGPAVATDHRHEFKDVANPTAFLTFMQIELRPIPVVGVIQPLVREAEIGFSVVASGYYYMAGVLIFLEYRQKGVEDWTIAHHRLFNNTTLEFGMILEGLNPNTEYEVRVRLRDRLNPQLDEKSAVKVFTTNAVD